MSKPFEVYRIERPPEKKDDRSAMVERWLQSARDMGRPPLDRSHYEVKPGVQTVATSPAAEWEVNARTFHESMRVACAELPRVPLQGTAASRATNVPVSGVGIRRLRFRANKSVSLSRQEVGEHFGLFVQSSGPGGSLGGQYSTNRDVVHLFDPRHGLYRWESPKILEGMEDYFDKHYSKRRQSALEVLAILPRVRTATHPPSSGKIVEALTQGHIVLVEEVPRTASLAALREVLKGPNRAHVKRLFVEVDHDRYERQGLVDDELNVAELAGILEDNWELARLLMPQEKWNALVRVANPDPGHDRDSATRTAGMAGTIVNHHNGDVWIEQGAGWGWGRDEDRDRANRGTIVLARPDSATTKVSGTSRHLLLQYRAGLQHVAFYGDMSGRFK